MLSRSYFITSSGVEGFNATPTFFPKGFISWIVLFKCFVASAWTVIMSENCANQIQDCYVFVKMK